MTDVYIDTSVLGAYYCPEALSETAERLLRDIDRPVISFLSDVEFCSLVAKKVRIGDFVESAARKILGLYQAHFDQGHYRKIAVEAPHYWKARELLTEFSTALRTLDALHLAIASHEGFGIMTADRVMAAAAKTLTLDWVFVE